MKNIKKENKRGREQHVRRKGRKGTSEGRDVIMATYRVLRWLTPKDTGGNYMIVSLLHAEAHLGGSASRHP